LRLHLSLALTLLLASSCTFASTARHWNGVVGQDGKPIYVTSTTNVGVNLAVAIPLFGNTTLDTMVGKLTQAISADGGNEIRIVESSSENYWYGFPPFTWILTPVITTVSGEYKPSTEVLQKDRAEQANEK